MSDETRLRELLRSELELNGYERGTSDMARLVNGLILSIAPEIEAAINSARRMALLEAADIARGWRSLDCLCDNQQNAVTFCHTSIATAITNASKMCPTIRRLMETSE